MSWDLFCSSCCASPHGEENNAGNGPRNFFIFFIFLWVFCKFGETSRDRVCVMFLLKQPKGMGHWPAGLLFWLLLGNGMLGSGEVQVQARTVRITSWPLCLCEQAPDLGLQSSFCLWANDQSLLFHRSPRWWWWSLSHSSILRSREDSLRFCRIRS